MNLTNKVILANGMKQIHIYNSSDVLRPRGHLKKESIGLDIRERLMSVYESWTDKKYSDNPDKATLLKTLKRNMEEEVEGAWEVFIEQIASEEG